MSIPVICDRCRATGITGSGDFAHLGDLLDFAPVPRKTKRADGWTPDKQRAFIAALSATGSKRQAAQAVGMAPYGVDQMLKSEGNDAFKAAFDRAMAIAARHGSMKIARGVADAAARNAQLAPPPLRLRGLPPPVEPAIDEDSMEEQKLELLQNVATKFMRKVAVERAARLEGRIVAADFYLRQITFLETIFDLASNHFGFNAREVLADLRRGPYDINAIVSTPFADWLDDQRRTWWEQEGEPERPPHPDPRFLERHSSAKGDFATYVDQHATGAMTTPARGFTKEQWATMSHAAQQLARQVQFDEDAVEQLAWEARTIAAHRAGLNPAND